MASCDDIDNVADDTYATIPKTSRLISFSTLLIFSLLFGRTVTAPQIFLAVAQYANRNVLSDSNKYFKKILYGQK